jgi:hypothetical protein
VSFKTVQKKLQGQGHSKESAGKILGAAAQKAKHPSANQRKVLGAQKGKKRPAKKATSAKKGQPAGKHKPPSWMHVAKGK